MEYHENLAITRSCFYKSLGALYEYQRIFLHGSMNLVGKRTPIHRRKKNSPTQRKQQKEQYTQVSLCVYEHNFTPRE